MTAAALQLYRQQHCSFASTAAAQLLQHSCTSSTAVTAQLHQQHSDCSNRGPDSLAEQSALQLRHQQPCSRAAMQPCSSNTNQRLCSLAVQHLQPRCHMTILRNHQQQPCRVAACIECARRSLHRQHYGSCSPSLGICKACPVSKQPLHALQLPADVES